MRKKKTHKRGGMTKQDTKLRRKRIGSPRLQQGCEATIPPELGRLP